MFCLITCLVFLQSLDLVESFQLIDTSINHSSFTEDGDWYSFNFRSEPFSKEIIDGQFQWVYKKADNADEITFERVINFQNTVYHKVQFQWSLFLQYNQTDYPSDGNIIFTAKYRGIDHPFAFDNSLAQCEEGLCSISQQFEYFFNETYYDTNVVGDYAKTSWTLFDHHKIKFAIPLPENIESVGIYDYSLNAEMCVDNCRGCNGTEITNCYDKDDKSLCFANFVPGPESCVCQEGTYFTKLQAECPWNEEFCHGCSICPIGCKACSSDSVCTQCLDGFSIQNDKCVSEFNSDEVIANFDKEAWTIVDPFPSDEYNYDLQESQSFHQDFIQKKINDFPPSLIDQEPLQYLNTAMNDTHKGLQIAYTLLLKNNDRNIEIEVDSNKYQLEDYDSTYSLIYSEELINYYLHHGNITILHDGTNLNITIIRTNTEQTYAMVDFSVSQLYCPVSCQSCSNYEICDSCETGYEVSQDGSKFLIQESCIPIIEDQEQESCDYFSGECSYDYESELYMNENAILFGAFILVNTIQYNDFLYCFSTFYSQFIKIIDYKAKIDSFDLNFVWFLDEDSQLYSLYKGKFAQLLIFILFVSLPIYVLGNKCVKKTQNSYLKHLYYLFVWNLQYSMLYNSSNYIFQESIFAIINDESQAVQIISCFQIVILFGCHLLISKVYSEYIFDKYRPREKVRNINLGRAVTIENKKIMTIKFQNGLPELGIMNNSISNSINFSYVSMLLLLRSLIFVVIKNSAPSLFVYYLFGINLVLMILILFCCYFLQRSYAVFFIANELNVYFLQLLQIISLCYPKDSDINKLTDVTEQINIIFAKYSFFLYILYSGISHLQKKFSKNDVIRDQKKHNTLAIRKGVDAVRFTNLKIGDMHKWDPTNQTDNYDITTQNIQTIQITQSNQPLFTKNKNKGKMMMKEREKNRKKNKNKVHAIDIEHVIENQICDSIENYAEQDYRNGVQESVENDIESHIQIQPRETKKY